MENFKVKSTEELIQAIIKLGEDTKAGRISLHDAMKKAEKLNQETKRKNHKIFSKKKWWQFWK